MATTLKPSNYKKLSIDFKRLQQIDIFSIEKYFDDVNQTPMDIAEQTIDTVRLIYDDSKVYTYKLPITDRSGTNEDIKGLSIRSYIESQYNAYCGVGLTYMLRSNNTGKANSVDPSEIKEYAIPVFELSEPIVNASFEIIPRGKTYIYLDTNIDNYYSWYNNWNKFGSKMLEFAKHVKGNAGEIEDWDGESRYVRYNEFNNNWDWRMTYIPSKNINLQPYLKKVYATDQVPDNDEVITDWVPYVLYPDNYKKLDVPHVLTKSLHIFSEGAVSRWDSNDTIYGHYQGESVYPRYMPYPVNDANGPVYTKDSQYKYICADLNKIDFIQERRLFTKREEKINDYRYQVGYSFPILYAYEACSEYIVTTAANPDIRVRHRIDSRQFIDEVTSITIKLTGKVKYSAKETYVYKLDASNNLVTVDNNEGLNTYIIKGSKFITKAINYNGKTFEEEHIKPLLLKYREGKYKAKVTVSASWCLAHQIEVDSEIELYDINNESRGIYLVKNMKIVFNSSSFNYELSLIQK